VLRSGLLDVTRRLRRRWCPQMVAVNGHYSGIESATREVLAAAGRLNVVLAEHSTVGHHRDPGGGGTSHARLLRGAGKRTLRDVRRAISCREQVQQRGCRSQGYSIISSARASRIGGTSMPSALAVFKLTTNLSLVGNSIGKSPALAPLSMRSTKSAARR
jgi:hypothetical protein